jgi:DNA-binding transcriptional MerR regulator
MALFGKKQREPAPEFRPGPVMGVPTERVIQLRQQGVPNSQIADMLKQEGYSDNQIYDAISQADIKGVVEMQPGQEVDITVQQGYPQQTGIYPEQMQQGFPQMPPPMPRQQMPPPMPEPMPQQFQQQSSRSFEEIAESIIDEKWEELMKNLDKVVSWKEETETRLVKIEQQISDIKERFDELHKGILGKVGEYDETLKSVGSDIKAMDAAFKKILPTFTENVGELSRITKGLKERTR